MPECGVKPHATFFSLCGLTLQLLLKRWPLYSAAAAVAFVVQVLLVVAWHVPHGIDLGNSVALPILATLVYAFVAADAGKSPVETKAVWERFLERAWAVILIDFALTYVSSAGIEATFSPDPFGMFAALPLFGLSALLLFVEPSATIDDEVTVWSLIPRAFVRGVAAALNLRVFVRALAIFSLELLIFAVQLELYAVLLHAKVADADFWAWIPLATVAAPVVAALTVLVYRDATSPAQAE